MQELINTFLEEATDLIAELEDALLSLETDTTDKEAVNRVFRVMHTLKGSGSMFGYESVSNFTHKLESLYDKIRNGEKELTTNIFNITLRSLDHIKELFDAKGKPGEELKKKEDELLQLISGELSENTIETGGNNTETAAKAEGEDTKENKTQEGTKSYYIDFKPNKEIMQNGTNPLYLIDELHELGKLFVFANPSAIPPFDKLNPEFCYVDWEFILVTAAEHSDIVDVFIFVDDEAEIDIENICDSDISLNDDFEDFIDSLKNSNEKLSIVTLQNFCQKQKTKPAAAKTPVEKPGLSPSPSTEKTQNEETKTRINKQSKFVTGIRVSSIKIEELMNLVSELVINQAGLELYATQTGNLNLINAVEKNKKLISRLRDNALDISLIPLSQLTTRFKRLIRDLSVELGKEIHFENHGSDTELDKAIIDRLSEPLMHIFRNAIDHGIEAPEERLQAGKAKEGRVSMHSYYSGSNVVIEISDDGKGIDPEKIRVSAIAKGIISPEAEMSDADLVNLIFAPGFSTAQKISEISGRGVGMDVVRKKISDLQGEVKVESTPGQGTKFIIQIPLTLSIIDALLLEVGDSTYIIGMQLIKKIFRIGKKEAENVFNNMVSLEGRQYPLINLRKKFNIKSDVPENQYILLIQYENRHVGILVDKVLREIQAVVKPISGQMTRDELISGASILGDGSIALVLNTNVIMNKYT